MVCWFDLINEWIYIQKKTFPSLQLYVIEIHTTVMNNDGIDVSIPISEISNTKQNIQISSQRKPINLQRSINILQVCRYIEWHCRF